jgi:Fe-S-cluster containining protein
MRDAEGEGTAAKGRTELELPLVRLPSEHPCASCGDCCRYLAVEIDPPTNHTDYDHIYWYLTHRGVSVYIDWEGDWYVEFQTVCEHLTEESTCGIYRERPEICSEFEWDSCERATKESAAKVHFHTPKEFFVWMEEKRPRAWAKLQKHREKLLAARQKSAAES